MRKRRLKVIAALLIALLACMSLEAAARLFWMNGPALILPDNDDIFMKVKDPAVYYALRPGERFYYQGAAGFINSKGLRGGSLKTPKPAGVFRVVMVGDELVFGPGLGDGETWPAQLEKALRKYSGKNKIEVANAGVPDYNFARSSAFLFHVAKLQPDLVLLVVSENDFDMQGVGDPRGRRPIAPSPELETRRGAFPALGNLMLPDHGARLRYALANASRGYLMAALFFKGAHGAGREGVPGELLNSKYAAYGDPRPADSSSCQSAKLLWEPMAESLKKTMELAKKEKFKFAGVLYSDYQLRGRAAIKVLDSFEKAGAPLVNMSVYRKSEAEEYREHSLGWINFPNSAARRNDAEALIGALDESGLLREPGLKQAPPGAGNYIALARARKKMYFEILNGQEVRDQVARNDFRSGLDFSRGGSGAKGQMLYGWWPPISMAWMGRPDDAWVSDSASVILSNPDESDTLHVEGSAYAPAADALGGMKVSFSFECMKPDTIYIANGDYFSADVPIPPELTGHKQLEVAVGVSNPFTPESMGGKEGDNRLASLGVSLMELRKTAKKAVIAK